MSQKYLFDVFCSENGKANEPVLDWNGEGDKKFNF